MAIYSTTAQEGIDINNVFILDPKGTPEYPAPPFVPGELAWGTDGSEWVYVTSSVSVPAASVLLVSPVPGSWSVSLIGGTTVATAPTGQLVAVAGGSAGTLSAPAPTGTQTGNYFWAQRAGNCPNVSCAAATADNTLLHTTATVPGQVSSSSGGSGTTFQINGMVISQAAGSTTGPNTAILNFPTAGVTA